MYLVNGLGMLSRRALFDGRIRVFSHEFVDRRDHEQELFFRYLAVAIQVVEVEYPAQLFVHGAAR